MFAYDAAYGVASYAALNGDSVVVSTSPTGIVTSEGDFRSGLEFVDVEETSGTEDYDLFGAKVKHVNASLQADDLLPLKKKARPMPSSCECLTMA